MNHPMHAPAGSPEAMMDRTVIVRIGGFGPDDARFTLPMLVELERCASQLARNPGAFELEDGRAAAMDIGGRTYRTAGSRLAIHRNDESVLVQERAGPGSVHFGSRRHEIALRYTDRIEPTSGLVPMPEFGARVAVAARLAIAACLRIAEGDRIIETEDVIAMMDAAENRIHDGPPASREATATGQGDRLSFASPWTEPHADRDGVPLPPSVRSRHWAMRHGVRLLTFGHAACFTVMDPVVRTRGAGTADPVARMRRHHRDAELRRRFADWGLCTPGDDQEDAA